MNKENRPLIPVEKLHVHKERLAQFHGRSEVLVNAMQVGKAKFGNSLADTVEVARFRARHKSRLEKTSALIAAVDQEMEGYEQAKKHSSDLRKMGQLLAEADGLIAKKVLTTENIEPYRKDFENLKNQPQTNPFLARGLARLESEREQREQREQKTTLEISAEPKRLQESAELQDIIEDQLIDATKANPLPSRKIKQAFIDAGFNEETAQRKTAAFVRAKRDEYAKIGTEIKTINLPRPKGKLGRPEVAYYTKDLREKTGADVIESPAPANLPEENGEGSLEQAGDVFQGHEQHKHVLEKIDPQIPVIMEVYLDRIKSEQGLRLPGYASTIVNRTKLGAKKVDFAELAELSIISATVGNRGNRLYDAAAIAAGLYIVEHGKNLTPQEKKKVEGYVRRVQIAIAQRELQKKEQNGKK